MKRSADTLLLLSVLTVGGCAGVLREQLAPPERHSLVREQLVVHSDFPLPAQHRLLEELTARRFDVSRRLALPLSDEPIHVYLFDDAEEFHTFIRLNHPEFPKRRAFFVETDTRLVVYAHWGDRVAEDLRHEVTHGYVHSAVPNVPLWLDEGLAEYFEVSRGRTGMNHAHLALLLARVERDRWQPDLRRMEQLTSSFDMTRDDYAEAWGWVHFLLHSQPEYGELLRHYLYELRRDGLVEPLSLRLGRLANEPERAVIEHVRRLGAGFPR